MRNSPKEAKMHFAAWNPAHDLWSTLCGSSSVCQRIAKWADEQSGQQAQRCCFLHRVGFTWLMLQCLLPGALIIWQLITAPSGRRLSDVMETHSLNFIPKLVIRPETSWDEPRLSYSTPLLRLKLIWFFIDLFLIISPHWWNLTMLTHMTWHMISFYCQISTVDSINIPLINDASSCSTIVHFCEVILW